MLGLDKKLLLCMFVCFLPFMVLQAPQAPLQALLGLFWGVLLGTYLGMYIEYRANIISLNGTDITHRYLNHNGRTETLTRESPAGFAYWTPREKMRWIARARKDLEAQALAHLEREKKSE